MRDGSDVSSCLSVMSFVRLMSGTWRATSLHHGRLRHDPELAKLVAPARFAAGIVPNQPSASFRGQRVGRIALDHRDERLAGHRPLPILGQLFGDRERRGHGLALGHLFEHRADLAQHLVGIVQGGRRRLGHQLHVAAGPHDVLEFWIGQRQQRLLPARGSSRSEIESLQQIRVTRTRLPDCWPATENAAPEASWPATRSTASTPRRRNREWSFPAAG